MGSSLRKAKFLATPHSVGSAGRLFDERCAKLNNLDIIEFNKLTIGQILASRYFWKYLFFGYAVAIYAARLRQTEAIKNLKSDDYLFSRSLSLFLPNVRSILFHNIEKEYYLEESRSRKIGIRKLADFHQYFILLLFEKHLSKNIFALCISLRDYRILATNNLHVEFLPICKVQQLLKFEISYSDEKLCIFHKSRFEKIDPGQFFFYGNFNNIRNTKVALEMVRSWPDIEIYGISPSKLPIECRENYKGVLDINAAVSGEKILYARNMPQAGVQTKILEWLEAGGAVACEEYQIEKMGINVQSLPNI